jgi:hypothetical protein
MWRKMRKAMHVHVQMLYKDHNIYIYTKNECCQGIVSISNFVAKGSVTLGVRFFKASQDESKGAI